MNLVEFERVFDRVANARTELEAAEVELNSFLSGSAGEVFTFRGTEYRVVGREGVTFFVRPTKNAPRAPKAEKILTSANGAAAPSVEVATVVVTAPSVEVTAPTVEVETTIPTEEVTVAEVAESVLGAAPIEDVESVVESIPESVFRAPASM